LASIAAKAAWLSACASSSSVAASASVLGGRKLFGRELAVDQLGGALEQRRIRRRASVLVEMRRELLAKRQTAQRLVEDGLRRREIALPADLLGVERVGLLDAPEAGERTVHVEKGLDAGRAGERGLGGRLGGRRLGARGLGRETRHRDQACECEETGTCESEHAGMMPRRGRVL
jgi:hypothetical protein